MSTGLTPLVRRVAVGRRWLDAVDSARKIHRSPVPRLGGVAIVAAFFAPFIGRLLINGPLHLRFPADGERVWMMLGGAVAVALLGLYDDFRGAGARTKFTVQTLVAIAMFYSGLRIDRIAVPWGEPLSLGLLALPATVVWIVGVVNAVNLIDGLDGLAGGVAVIALASIFSFSLIRGDALMMFTSAALAGAVLGFLFFNFNPARIFMGDTGSMFVGFILAVTSLMSSEKSPTAVAIVVPAMVLALPLADTTLAIVRRALHRRPLFDADRGHVHHRMLAAGFSQRQTVLLLYGLAAFFGAIAQLIWVASDAERIVMVGCVVALAFIFARRLGCLQPAIDEPTLVEAATLLFVPRQDLLRARSEDEIWRTVLRFAAVVGADSVSVSVARETTSVVYHSTLSSAESGDADEQVSASYRGNHLAEIVLVWSREAMNRKLLAAWVESLGRNVNDAMHRLAVDGRPALGLREGASTVTGSAGPRSE